jgi:hypothetical protein
MSFGLATAMDESATKRFLRQQPQRRSNSAKLTFEICGAAWRPFVGRTVDKSTKTSDFQAEDEASIPSDFALFECST